MNIGEKCGLEINKNKSNIIIWNMKEQPEAIEGVKVTDTIKYLGLKLENTRNIFKQQKVNMIQKGRKLANLTYSVIARSCNKIMVGKAYWKGVVIPSILYGASIININETEIKTLQRIENGVYRNILGASKYAPICTLRGEIGASLMKTRIINGRFQYLKSIEEGENQLLKEIVGEMFEDDRNKWMKVTKTYMNTVGVRRGNIIRMKKTEIKEATRKWDSANWKEEVNSKSSLVIYKRWKENIKEEKMYDNRPSSIILYKARSGTLQLNDRKRHTNGEVKCTLCGHEYEDLKHFILVCPSTNNERTKAKELQQPYQEDEIEIMGDYLFKEENLQEKKEILYKMWKKRELIIKSLTPN